MRSLMSWISALFLCCSAFVSHAETLKLLNWEEYLSETVVEQWQAQSGLGVEQVYFDNDEKRDRILLNSTKHDIDLAVVDEVIAERFGKAGLLVRIDEEKVPTLKHVDPFWRQRCGDYAVPYLWGTLGIAYRSDKVKTPPTSWHDLLQPSESLQGHIGMVNDYTDMLAPALFLAGRSLSTENEQALKAAFNVLKAQAPQVLTYQYAITYLQSAKTAEQLHMALVYGGDQYVLNDIAGEEELWQYSVPKEGTVLWVDCLAVSSDSNNIDQALAFINYLNTPEIAAKNAEDVYFATPNNAAMEYLPDDFKNNPQLFPPQEVLDNSELYSPLSAENIQLRQRITNAVIKAHESR